MSLPFRVQRQLFILRLKQRLEDFFVWALTKLNYQRLTNVLIEDERTLLGYAKLIPEGDNEWHHVAYSIDFWLKRGEGRELSKKFKAQTYKDGVKVFAGS